MQKNTRPIVFLFLIAVLAALAIPAVSATYQNYTAAGTYYWVAPDGESYINLILTGGGAAGTKGNPVAGGGNGGYGGGAGSTNTQNSIPVTSGVNYTIVVGDGGLSGTISSPGSNSSAFSYTATGGSVNGGSAYSGVNGGAGAAGYTEDGVGGSAGSGTAAYGSVVLVEVAMDLVAVAAVAAGIQQDGDRAVSEIRDLSVSNTRYHHLHLHPHLHLHRHQHQLRHYSSIYPPNLIAIMEAGFIHHGIFGHISMKRLILSQIYMDSI